jgi:hypothetical protein
MSRLLEGAHVFDYFTKFDYGICPSKTIVGKINSVEDYNKLIPSPDTRVEIERAPGVEEIRVIKDETGDYHVTADHAIAREVLKEIDQTTFELYKPDIMPYPDTFTNLKNVTFHRDIIRYDQDGDRLLPGIRRVGFLSTMEEWNAMQTDEMVGYVAEVFVGLENTKTGDVWWATDELKKEILKRRRQLEEEDDETEDVGEENEENEAGGDRS